MISILTLLLIVTISLLVNRIATVALTFTGISRDMARFQARSAFTGAGFTTSESELITQHPVRRRIVMMLMFLGNAGLVTVIATLMTGFVNFEDDRPPLDLSQYEIRLTGAEGADLEDYKVEFLLIDDEDAEEPDLAWYQVIFGTTAEQQALSRVLVLVLGILLLWTIANSRYVDDQLYKIISSMLRRFTNLDTFDFHGILHLSEGYTVTEFDVTPEHWLTGRNLMDLRLTDEGIQVLGVMRKNNDYIGTPTGQTFIRSEDRLIIYGRGEHIDELVNRQKGQEGEEAHQRRIAEHQAERAGLAGEDRTEPRPEDEETESDD